MRGQVQQLAARHEACKKELAASETVSYCYCFFTYIATLFVIDPSIHVVRRVI